MLSLLTFNDAIAHLRDAHFGIAQDSELILLKRSARGAYRDLMDAHRWNYGFIEYGRRLVAPYETGTISYEHDGGVYDRMVRLTDGTWPAEAAHYKLDVGGEVYVVDERKSASVITLDETLNPGEDIDAGESFTLYRDTYPLPDDFLKIDDVLNNGNPWFNWYLEPNEYLAVERQRRSLTSQPFHWTIMADAERPGGYCLRVTGYPTTAQNIVFLYQRAFQEPVLSGLEANSFAGTVSLVKGSTSVAGTSTTFSEKMEGAILRVSDDATNLPTDNNGLYPFAQEHRIKEYVSPNSLILSTPATANASGKKFVISDLLDMDRTMFNAFLRGAERQLAIIANKDAKQLATAEQNYYSAVRLAMQQDNKTTIRRVAGGVGGGLGPIEWVLTYGSVEEG